LSTGTFPNLKKMAKVRPILRKAINYTFPITGQSQFSLYFQKFLKLYVQQGSVFLNQT
jgi:hypothetical protein